MFSAALIVYREALEAALVVGIVAAATRMIAHRDRWIALGIALGCAGALALASVADILGRWANGMGHELFNAAALAVAVAMLAWHNIWMSRHGRQYADQARALGASASKGELAMSAVAIAIALTVLREGAETVLFFYGVFAGSGASSASLAQGSILGLVAGVGTGVILYRGLVRIPLRHLFSVTSVLLLLVTAGMAAQLAQILIQADVLPPIIQPLWDTSRLLPPESSAGTLLHALVGYDAQPSATQVAFAGIVLVGVFLATRMTRRG